MISYVSQYQAWARGNRRDAYGNFITHSTSWSVYMGELATAIKSDFSYEERERYWKRVHDARTSALSAYAQVRMLGRDRTGKAANNVVTKLQHVLNLLDKQDCPDMREVDKEFETARDEFVVAARREMSWSRS